MALDWLSRLLSRFSIQLGGSNPSSVWSYGRGSISENIFQNQQIQKFTPSYTYEINTKNILDHLDLVSNFSYANEAVNRLNTQRQANLDFIDSEVETLRNIVIPTPQFTSYERVGKRPSAGEVAGRPFSYGSGGGVRRRYWINPTNYAQNQREQIEFAEYKENALSQINASINNFIEKRDLITSKAPFSL